MQFGGVNKSVVVVKLESLHQKYATVWSDIENEYVLLYKNNCRE